MIDEQSIFYYIMMCGQRGHCILFVNVIQSILHHCLNMQTYIVIGIKLVVLLICFECNCTTKSYDEIASCYLRLEMF